MEIINFLKKFQRMCTFYEGCIHCPFATGECLINSPISMTEHEMIQFINTVEEWTEEHPIEIDWTKVPRNTPVLVSDSLDKENWKKRYFCAYVPHSIDGKFLTFYDGDDENNAYDVSYWHYCKLAPEATSMLYLKTEEK